MGYGGSLKDAGRAVGQSGDGWIDGIMKADRPGLDAIYIQAKRWAAGRIQRRRDGEQHSAMLCAPPPEESRPSGLSASRLGKSMWK
jgi:hypothetical protein